VKFILAHPKEKEDNPVRRLMIHASAILALLVGTTLARADGGCGDYGTSVNFFKTPSDAATQAKKDQKLVMVLHVSGNFENPEQT
jgi:hypothetical protein